MIANTLVIGASMETKRLPRILALHSTGPDSSSATPFENIMRSELERKLGSRVQVENRFLELDRFRHTEHAQALARTLRDDYSLNALDLIVPIGFPALQFTTTHLAGSFPNTAVLFVAVAARRIQDFRLPSNTTGVVHIDDWKGALASILDIHPDCEQIVVVSGSAPSDHEQLEIQKSLFQPFENRVRFRYLVDLSLEEMIQTVSHLPLKSVVIQGAFTWDGVGQMLTDDGALRAIYKAANAPVYALVGNNLGQGFVGGPMAALHERYLLGADVAFRILRGAQPKDIPIQKATPKYAMAFDWRQLQRWNISTSRLPIGSLIEFREASLWNQYPWLGLALPLLFASGIIPLLYKQNFQRYAGAARQKALRVGRHLKLTTRPDDSRILTDVSPDQVNEVVELICKSKPFSRSPRMMRFLKFVVAEKLNGQGGDLNEYNIARSVYDRPATFDPKSDNIVRVEARRLRTKLQDYYSSNQGSHIFIIEIPTGSYEPIFLQGSSESVGDPV